MPTPAFTVTERYVFPVENKRLGNTKLMKGGEHLVKLNKKEPCFLKFDPKVIACVSGANKEAQLQWEQ